MAAPHNQNNLQQKMAYRDNGVNADDHDQDDMQQNVLKAVNGDDEFSLEQLLSSSDDPLPELEQRLLDMELGMYFENEPQPNFKEVLFRGVYLCRRLLACLAERFVHQPLNQAAYAAVTSGMAAAQDATDSIHAAACQNQTMMWYMTAPLSVYKFVVGVGVDLAEKYLDLTVPENQSAVNWFRLLNLKMDDLVEFLTSSPVPSLDEEEPAEQEPPESCGMFFTVPLVEVPTGEEQTQGGVEKEGDKREKMEEKAQEKGEEQRPERAARDVEKSAEQAEPAAPPESLPSASEVQPATMGVGPQGQSQSQPSAQPGPSKDLAAEESSEEAPGPSKRAEAESHGAKEKSLPPGDEAQTSAMSGEQSPLPASVEESAAKVSSAQKRRPRRRVQRETHRDKKAKLLWKVFGSQFD